MPMLPKFEAHAGAAPHMQAADVTAELLFSWCSSQAEYDITGKTVELDAPLAP